MLPLTFLDVQFTLLDCGEQVRLHLDDDEFIVFDHSEVEKISAWLVKWLKEKQG